MMRRFSSRVVRSTSVTWSDQVLPTTVQTGAPESSSAWTLASSSGLPPTRQVEPKAAMRRVLQRHVAGPGEELDVLGVGAGPAALDEGHAELVEPAGDPQLVLDREADPLPLGAVAEGGVVDLDHA